MHKPIVMGPSDGDVPAVTVHAIEAERARWSAAARPLGTVSPPGTVRGVTKTMIEKLEGHTARVLIDKLGERLAFERTAVRLYDALLAKYEAAVVHPGGPTRREIEQIRDEEIRHFAIVRDAILQLGADATAMTPCGDVVGVAGQGWVQVLTDPRSTLSQCLVVMLGVEVTDEEGWELLITLAESLGFADIAERFRFALFEEEQHAVCVRRWVGAAVIGPTGARRTFDDETAI
ncbi:MAG TPA: ferritin-like domain-containing protein [Kofleriaceae bacterium]